VNGVGDIHGITPPTVYVACWTTTLPTAATRRTSQLSRRADPVRAEVGVTVGGGIRAESRNDV
jgi:hypothetical protein